MRWEEEATVAALRAGYRVKDTAGINDYQGWGVLLLHSAAKGWAVLSWTYGSCGGCDSYEDMDDTGRAKAFDALIDVQSDEPTARLTFDSRKGW